MTNIAKFDIHETMFDDELDFLIDHDYHVTVSFPSDDYDHLSLITGFSFE